MLERWQGPGNEPIWQHWLPSSRYNGLAQKIGLLLLLLFLRVRQVITATDIKHDYGRGIKEKKRPEWLQFHQKTPRYYCRKEWDISLLETSSAAAVWPVLINALPTGTTLTSTPFLSSARWADRRSGVKCKVHKSRLIVNVHKTQHNGTHARFKCSFTKCQLKFQNCLGTVAGKALEEPLISSPFPRRQRL